MCENNNIDDGSKGFNYNILGNNYLGPDYNSLPDETPTTYNNREDFLSQLQKQQQEYYNPSDVLGSILGESDNLSNQYNPDGSQIVMPDSLKQIIGSTQSYESYPETQKVEESKRMAVSYGGTVIPKPDPNNYGYNMNPYMMQAGINNQYYGFNGYSNPYMDYIQQQYQSQQVSQRQQELNMWKSISRHVNRSNGMSDEDIEKHINEQYDYKKFYKQDENPYGYHKETHEENWDRMAHRFHNEQTPVYDYGDAQVSQRERQKYQVNSLLEFFDNLATYDWNIRIEEEQRRQYDLTNKYNPDFQRQLLYQTSNPNSPIRKMFGEGLESRDYIDSLNAKLGNLFESNSSGTGNAYRDEYEEKRRAFIETVMRK